MDEEHEAKYINPWFEYKLRGISERDDSETISCIVTLRDSQGGGSFIIRFDEPGELLANAELLHSAALDLVDAQDYGLDQVIKLRGEEDTTELTTEDLEGFGND